MNSNIYDFQKQDHIGYSLIAPAVMHIGDISDVGCNTILV